MKLEGEVPDDCTVSGAFCHLLNLNKMAGMFVRNRAVNS